MTATREAQVHVDYRAMTDDELDVHAAAIRAVQADRALIASEESICESLSRQIDDAQAEKARTRQRAADARAREGLGPEPQED